MARDANQVSVQDSPVDTPTKNETRVLLVLEQISALVAIGVHVTSLESLTWRSRTGVRCVTR